MCGCVCSIDQLLDGGLYTAEITEVIGPVASGKTQVDTRLSINPAAMVPCLLNFIGSSNLLFMCMD